MTAPGSADPTPGAPASPAPAAPAAPPPGFQVNPPVPGPAPAAVPAPQQPAPQQPAALPAAPAGQPPVALPAAQTPAHLPVPAAQPSAALPVPAAQPSAALAVPAAQATPTQPAATQVAPAQVGSPAPPAPPKPPAAKAKSKSGGGGGGYLVAVFALIIAVIAAGAAAYSLKIAMDLRDENAAPAVDVTDEPTSTESPESEPTASASPTPTTPPGPNFTPELDRLEVRVPNPTGCTAAYVDVDTANVGVETGHEFYLSRCQNPNSLQVRVDRTSGRSTSNTDPSAEECASLIAGTPTSELVLTAEAGVTFCLFTNRAQATSQRLPQRLAIVEVLTVSTAEVRLALSTYRVEE